MFEIGDLRKAEEADRNLAELQRQIASLYALLEQRFAPARTISADPMAISAAPFPSADHVKLAMLEYRRRRLRSRAFGGYNFNGEPGWDILLDLLAHSARGHLRATAACIGSAVPATTALRHLEQLEAAGFIKSVPDKNDRRARNIALTSLACECFDRYFDGPTEKVSPLSHENELQQVIHITSTGL